MKTLKFSIMALALGLMSFHSLTPSNQSIEKTNFGATVTWKSETIDLGDIPQAKPKEIVFEFKNTGTTDIIVTNVQASCGCTGTQFPKEPISVGKTAKITATFNAANKGAFSKTITVFTNSDASPKVLTFKGNVI